MAPDRIALLALLAAVLAALLPAHAARAAREQRLLAAFSVNGLERPAIAVLLRGEDILARVADLEAAGLHGFAGAREQQGGTDYVSLASLGPSLRFQLDERAVALRLTADPQLLPAARLDLAPARPSMTLSRETSAYLNYSLSLDDRARLTSYGEAGLSVASALLYSGFSRAPDGSLARGVSSLTYDQPEEMRRLVAGDVFATSGALGASLLLGGASVAREFSLDPYHPRTPLPRASIAALTPSEVDVYVNGQLVRQQQVAPGTLQIENVPATSGLGTVRTVVRDAFGRTQEFETSSYVSSGLLSPGLSDYQLAAGFARPNLARSFLYGEPVVLGRLRRGLTESFTAGVRAEASRGLVSGGSTATLLTPAGALEASAALSQDRGRAGEAFAFSWGFGSRRASLGAQLVWTSPSYANASVRAVDDRPELQTNLSAGVSLSRALSLGASYSDNWMRDTGRRSLTELRTTISLGGDASLLIAGGVVRAPGTAPAPEGSVFLSWAFGQTTAASATYATSSAGAVAAVDVQRTLPSGPGVGYRVHAENGAQPAASALLQVQGDHGLLSASYARSGPGQAGSVTAAGGLVLINSALFATRPVQDSFALIQVPGVSGVPATLNNQEIGRTDSSGNLLIPALLPYAANRLGIRVRSLSLAYKVGETEQVVAAPRRGGAVARFEVRRMHAVTGEIALVLPGGAQAPAQFGELSLINDGERLHSPLGSDGRFFLEQISSGLHQVEVLHAGGACRFTLLIPEAGSAPVQDLGKLLCDARPLLANARDGGLELSGRLFLDENRDGRFQPGEPPLSDVLLLAGGSAARTGPDGRFLLRADPAGPAPVAAKHELPDGFRLGAVGPDGDLPVLRPAPLRDLGAVVVLDLPEGPARMEQLQATRIPLEAFLRGKGLTPAEDASVQRLCTDVLDARDLRVLLVVRSPAGAADAFTRALAGARAALRYLRGPALVPPSLLLWTLEPADPSAPAGLVEIRLVRQPHRPSRALRVRTATRCEGKTPCR